MNGLRKDVWESNRARIMKGALEAKFEQSEPCRAFLKGLKENQTSGSEPKGQILGGWTRVKRQGHLESQQMEGTK